MLLSNDFYGIELIFQEAPTKLTHFELFLLIISFEANFIFINVIIQLSLLKYAFYKAH